MAPMRRGWPRWAPIAAAAALTAAAVVLVLRITTPRTRPATYAEAREVVDRRCIECHSKQPASRAFPIAPKGVRLDTAEEMRQHATRIKVRVIDERTMPLANMTAMTEHEREILGSWVDDGARIRPR